MLEVMIQPDAEAVEEASAARNDRSCLPRCLMNLGQYVEADVVVGLGQGNLMVAPKESDLVSGQSTSKLFQKFIILL